MSIKILYFAAMRDALDSSGEIIDLPDGVSTLGELRNHLANRGEQWAPLLTTKNLRMARNQRMVPGEEPVVDGDEVAFFPPVTGG